MENVMRKVKNESVQEPDPSSGMRRFAVGCDYSGRWMVCDALAQVGGIFRSKAAAMKFALAESGGNIDQVLCLPDSQRLSMDLFFAPTFPVFCRKLRAA